MAQPYIGEIRMFAGNFAPVGWMFCEGQLLPISENETLFQLIGTTYGGDGESTFGLPDLRGRIPLHMGTGPSGTTYQLAESAGVEEITLSSQQIPVHSHAFLVSGAAAGSSAPSAALPGNSRSADLFLEDSASVNLNAAAAGPIGGSQPHTNFQPYLCVNFIISLFGLFPSPT